MFLYNKYDQIEKEIIQKYPKLWEGLFESFNNTVIQRLNWILIYDDNVLVTKEIYQSHGEHSWNYILDEWCFLAECMDYNKIKHYYGIPPTASNLLLASMENLSYILNSSLIYDQLKEIHFSEKYSRKNKNGIDLVDNYMILDFGVNKIKTDLETNHNPEYKWVKLDSLDNIELYDLSIVQEVLNEYLKN